MIGCKCGIKLDGYQKQKKIKTQGGFSGFSKKIQK